jgi:hypothetical protein
MSQVFSCVRKVALVGTAPYETGVVLDFSAGVTGSNHPHDADIAAIPVVTPLLRAATGLSARSGICVEKLPLMVGFAPVSLPTLGTSKRSFEA